MQVTSLTKNQDPHQSPPLKYYCKNYTLIEIIKKKPQKQTCIVRNPEHQYLVAKKLPTNDKKILHEVNQQNVRHPNIISMKQCFIERDNLYVIQEFCEEGDLLYHIKRQIRKKQALFSENLIGHWLLQTLLAVQYLHNEKIIHRDIRPANLFLTSSGHIKLGSFKHSKALDSQLDFTNTILTSPYYMAPQLFQHKCYDYKIDIWAIGCLLYQICNLKVAYEHGNMVQQINRMNKNKPEQLPAMYSKNLVAIYHKCKKKNPLQRATALQLLKTSYFVELMAKFIKNRDLTSDMGRVPIKKYKIHINAKDRIKSAKLHQNTAGKSASNVETPKTQPFLRKNSRQKSRQKNIFQQRPPRSNSRPSSRQIQKSSSKEKKIVGSKINLSRQKQSKKVNSPNLPPMAPSPSQQLNKKVQKQHQEKHQKTKIETPPSSQKVTTKHPPLPSLARPPKLVEFKNQVQHRSRTQAQQQLSQFINEQSYLSTPNKPHENQQQTKKSPNQKQSITDVHDSLAKIFSDLKFREDDQQQFSFDLQEESQIRLTSTHDNSAQITTMYHSKLNQLIDEINYKYCPDMECIQQRTNQFDSNQFAKIKGFIAEDVKREQNSYQ